MARRREAVAPPSITGRDFTLAELERIHRIIEGWEARRDHPHPDADELARIHAAAGRRRGFKVWELDPVRDALGIARAFEEEATG